MKRPRWSRTFIEEPSQIDINAKPGLPVYTLVIGIVCSIGIVSEVALLIVTDIRITSTISILTSSAILLLYASIFRPRKFDINCLLLSIVASVLASVQTIHSWNHAVNLKLCLSILSTAAALAAFAGTIRLPMRDPTQSTDGISKPFSQPHDKLRSPEDNLSFWQWSSISWISPLLRLAKQRQLNEDDVWQLPYEFQHSFLHDAFRSIKGSVLRRLLIANWVDLIILTLLECVELITNYADPLLLQLLLRAMQHLDTQRKSALVYASLILLLRVVNAQSEVFSLWYGRRSYERSRGEMITMLYEKTLNRKIVAQSKPKDEDVDTPSKVTDEDVSTDENAPLLANKTIGKPTIMQMMSTQLHTLWQSFRTGIKGVDIQSAEPAALGKIMNLMRYDAYEVSQRFWEFQKLIEKPVGLILSLALILRLLGWPALVGVAVVVVAQILNYLLALVDIRFEKVRRSATDKRLQQTSQYIESIRHLRWYGWQNHWLKNVSASRQHELNIRAVSFLWVEIIIFNNVFSSGMITAAAFWAYTVLAKRELSVEVVFPALQIFNMIRDNMSDIPDLIQALLNAFVALKRIQTFMEEPDKASLAIETSHTSSTQIILSKASFAWPGLTENVLKDLNLEFDVGINIIAGEVAAGKSALLQAILGELDLRDGSIRKNNTPIAYCSQTPWLQSMTIRENILFNDPFDSQRYRQVLESCALIPDFASFEKGDLSPIGENGIGLSGGQKSRVALARALYGHAPVLLLDDPLSALDQQTSEHLVQKALQGSLIKDRTVILVTHRVDLCRPIADHLITMVDGNATIEVPGQEKVMHTNGHAVTGDEQEKSELFKVDTKLIEGAIPDKFEEEEYRAHGEIKARVYWEYLKAGNIIWWAITVGFILIARLLALGTYWYLKEFSEAYGQRREEDSGHLYLRLSTIFQMLDSKLPLMRRLFDRFPNPATNVTPWLIGLLMITLLEAIVLVFTNATLFTTRYLAGKNMFRAVMEKVSNTTFRYYDITPVGRLMNRLTSDIGQIDSGTGMDMFFIFYHGIAWVVSLAVIASITPLFLLVCICLTGAFVWIFFHFLPASQSLRRLETVSLSPLMTNFGTLLAGLSTVRAFRAEDRFQARLITVVDNFQRQDHFYWSVQSWLSYRLEILSAFSTLVLTIIAIYTNLSAGLTAFALVSAQKFVSGTHALCRTYGKLQVNFVSVERVVELLDLEQEPTNPVPPPAWWPSYSGSIVFENVSIRYAPHLDYALEDVSFELKGGSNTAIVGRTGSGKSTLAAALLATVPVEKGRILIDGHDLAAIDRQALRTRITFLAQEPVLFEGNLRRNLDPVNEHTDEECLDVVQRVAGRFGWTLSTAIEAGGKNLSQGQRQLIGLARAILRRSSIIIMDEATASIDVDTAWEIQRIMREELKGSTVITIAHRQAAVRDADSAIVLSKGKLESFGPVSASSTQSSIDQE